MKRKPKAGDVVYIVGVKDKIIGERTISKVGRTYFYCNVHDHQTWHEEVAFEIDSYVDGCWCQKYSEIGKRDYIAYLSVRVYDKQSLKEKRIDEILNEEFANMSCAKIQEIHAQVFETPHMDGAEDWEVADK
jgi:hypothetical protein